MGELNNFITKAQEAQHTNGKEQQTRKFLALQAKAYNTQWTFEPSYHKQEDITRTDCQDKWVINLSKRNHTQQEKRVLAKGQPRHLSSTDAYSWSHHCHRISHKAPNFVLAEAEQLRTEVSEAPTSTKIPPSIIIIEVKKAITLTKTTASLLFR